MIGVGVHVRLQEGDQVFVVVQLSKYLPGSVWPIVMQMEAGRRRGAARTTMLAANLITMLLGIICGLILAGLLLPFSSPAALHRFWWRLAALPLLLVLAVPRSFPFLFDGGRKVRGRRPRHGERNG